MAESNKVEDVLIDKKKKKYGDKFSFDPNFNGPIKNRSCTDCICLILYFVCALASLIIAIIAFSRSNPLLLVYPTDSTGQLCGYDKMASKPYLHFFDLIQCVKNMPSLVVSGCPTTQVCVERCPSTTWSWLALSTIESVNGGPDLATRQKELLCADHVNFTDPVWLKLSVQSLVEHGHCAPYLVPETPIMHRCVPSFIIQAGNAALGSAVPNATIVDANGHLINMDTLGSSKNAFSTFFQMQSWGEKCLADLHSSWRHIVAFVGIALIVSFLWIVLLRLVVGVVIWLSIIIFVLLWLCLTTFAFWRYNQMVHIVKAPEQLEALATIFSVKTNITSALVIPGETPDIWLGVSITCLVILVISLLALCFLGSRINLAIKLFEETSAALSHMPLVLTWPVFPFIVQMATIAWAVGTALCLATMGRPQFANSAKPGLIKLPDQLTSCDYTWALKAVSNSVATSSGVADSIAGSMLGVANASALILASGSNATMNSTALATKVNGTLSELCRFVKYTGTEFTIVLQIYNAFMFFWTYNFVAGYGFVVLAGCFASYYWAFKKPDDIPAIPLLSALWRTSRYHVGSVAFGSLLIAILQIIRFILDYIMYKMKQQKNYVAAFLVKCVECCFACLEKLVKFVTRKAYIMVAIHGKHFMASALDGWQLIMRNIVRSVVLSGVSYFVLIISKLVVTGGMIALAYFYFHGEIPSAIPSLAPTWPILNYFYVPIVVIGVASFSIASLCFHVYEVGVETTFLCFLEDCERNDGSDSRPYFMSKNLASILR